MELFLNVLWLLVALNILLVWRGYWIRQRPNAHRDPLAEWAAVGCVLVILFFAISLTDDLHQAVFLFDEVSTGRRHSSVLVSARDSSRSPRIAAESGAPVLPRQASDRHLIPIARVLVSFDISGSPLQYDVSTARAPPAFFF
jgi:hypothetical protein